MELLIFIFTANNNTISKLYFTNFKSLQDIFYNFFYFINNYHLLYLNFLNKSVINSINNLNQNKAFHCEDPIPLNLLIF